MRFYVKKSKVYQKSLRLEINKIKVLVCLLNDTSICETCCAKFKFNQELLDLFCPTYLFNYSIAINISICKILKHIFWCVKCILL